MYLMLKLPKLMFRMVPLNRKSDGKKGPNGISKDRQDQEAISLKKKEKKMQRNRDHAEKFGIRVEKRIYARVTNEVSPVAPICSHALDVFMLTGSFHYC
jgi:hypothetical protein